MTVLARRGAHLWLVVDSPDPLAPARVFDSREDAFIDAPRPLSAMALLKHGGWRPVERDEVPAALEAHNDAPAPAPETKRAKPKAAEEPQPAADREAARDRAARRLERYETRLADTLERYYARQRDVVLARLRGKQARKGTRHWAYTDPRDRVPVELKAIDVDRVLDPSRWRTEIEDDAEQIVLGIVRESMTDTAQDLGAEGLDLSLDQPELQDAIQERVKRILASTDARADLVRKVIMDADSTDEDLEAIVEQVRGTYDQRRVWAETTARTETTGAVNGGSFEAARRAGVTHKQWLSSRDDQVRDTHSTLPLGADGQTVPLELPFLVGGFPLQYPGDPLGPAQEVINCRCTMLFDREVDRDERRDDIAADRQIPEGGEVPRPWLEHFKALLRELLAQYQAYGPRLADSLSRNADAMPPPAALALLDALRAHAAACLRKQEEYLERAAGHREAVAALAPELLPEDVATSLVEALRRREEDVRAALTQE